jgi:WD40 repeat protein
VACSGTITDTTSSFDLGEGTFIPTQFFVSPDGSTAYILGNSSAGNPPSRMPFVMVFNVNTQTASALSLSNSATPLSASLSPDGKLLFVGADDGTLHVIDTTSGNDIQQVTFPFPTNELCFGPGNPLTQVPLSQVRISAVSESGSTGAYTYSLISGPALKVGQSITVANMSPGGNNGTFTITGLGTDAGGNPTFLVTNSNGASATNQSGTGTVPISCNPDLVAVRP